MSTAKNSELTWASVCRQNTGTHPMDSGGERGRHWQRPLPKRALSVQVSEGGARVDAYISLAHHLSACFEIDQSLTSALRSSGTRFYSEYAEWLSSRCGGVPIQVSDYTYNYDNDLDQDFQFSVLSTKEEWWCDDNALYIIGTHNGADARGGFSDPVVCRRISEDVDPLDTVVGFSSDDVDCYEIGYTKKPLHSLNQDADRFTKLKDGNWRVTMKDGSVIVGHFYCVAEG
jgi:hypothetical protein